MAILNKTIKIDNIESKFASTGNEGITLISGKDKYTFYRTVKGEDGEVYKAFKNMDVKPHDIVNIGYTEEDQEFTNEKGQLIKFKKRSVVGIREGQATQLSLDTEKPYSGANNASGGESKEAYGLRLAIHGMVNGMLASGKSPAEVSIALPALFGLEEDIEIRLNKPASMNVAEAKINQNLPIINVGDEFLSEDLYNTKKIPF